MDMVRALRPRVYRRLALTGGAAILFLWLLLHRLAEVDPAQVLRAMGDVGGMAWIGACLATWASFRAVAGYDLTLHRHLGTGVSPGRAGRAGFAAIAIGQTVGLGVVSGAFVRWRMLPELGLYGAMRLTFLVAVSFLAAWAVVTAAVLVLVPVAPFAAFGGIGLCLAVVAAAGSVVWPRPWVPNLITQGRLVGLAAVDCLAAGVALWLLVPGNLEFAGFLPVFLLAFGAGLVSGAPAGLGAFEIVLLWLMPSFPPEALLAGVLAWRGLYFGVPAVVGVAVAFLARPEDARRAGTSLSAPEIAEAGLVAQGDLAVHPAGFVAGRTAHGLVALSDAACLSRFQAAARDEGRWPVLYKAGPRAAARARKAGMAVLPVAREGWLFPQSFRLDLPARAGLRRKLRRAEAAEVTAGLDLQPDWSDLAGVNAAWAAARGGEHGFTMGRFAPNYVARQKVVVARQGPRVVGFASFHAALIAKRQVWTLDLLRPDPAAPDGTAQLMVMAGLMAARQAGVVRLSLAAVPIGGCPGERGHVARLGRWLAPQAASGLGRFKAGFAPSWQRLYIAGPSHAAVALVGWEIWRKVCCPAPLANMSRTTAQDADNEFASARNPWQREENTLA